MKFLRVVLPSVLGLGLLSGCQTYSSIETYISSDAPSKCPDAAILAPTATLPAFDPRVGADPTALQYQISMTSVRSRCDYDKSSRVADTWVKFKVEATRPPGGQTANYRVPYFVAVSSGGDVVTKDLHWLEFEFSGNSTTATADEVLDSVPVVVPEGKQAYDYHLLLGFQLTEAQIAYLAKMGRYEP